MSKLFTTSIAELEEIDNQIKAYWAEIERIDEEEKFNGKSSEIFFVTRLARLMQNNYLANICILEERRRGSHLKYCKDLHDFWAVEIGKGESHQDMSFEEAFRKLAKYRKNPDAFDLKTK